MDTAILILLIIATAAFLFAALWLFLPRKKETMNIHLDGDTKVNISKQGEAIRLDFVHVVDEIDEETADTDLFPEPDVTEETAAVRDAANVMDEDFFERLLRFESLDISERESVCGVLLRRGIINEAQMQKYVYLQREENPGVIVAEPEPQYREMYYRDLTMETPTGFEPMEVEL